MIADPEDNRRHGVSGAQAVCIIVACAVFMFALLALLPDS